MTDYELAIRLGVKQERERLIAFLREKRALRDSMFEGELVLYTEDGPIDLSPKELEGKND